MHNDFFEADREPERGLRRAAAAPRGYAKSTIRGLIKPIHDICYALEKYIVIFSNTDEQAAGRCRDIKTELLTNEKLIYCFGPFFHTRRIADTKFVAKSGQSTTMVQGFGAGAEVRGVKWGPHRPTKIVCDDIEHSEEVENETLRAKYAAWFFEVVSELGTKSTNIDVIGTVLHRNSLLKHLLGNPSYTGKLYKSVEAFHDPASNGLWESWRKIYTDLTNANRKAESRAFYNQNEPEMLKGVDVLWPEKESYYDIQCQILERGRRAFYKEKQNDPRSDEAHIFDLDALDYFSINSRGDLVIELDGRVVPKSELVACYGVMDPSTGKKPRRGTMGDYCCILTGVQDRYGYLYVTAAMLKRMPPTQQITSIFDHYDVWHYDKFGIESNLYRSLLIEDIKREKTRIEAERKAKGILHWRLPIRLYDIVNTDNKEDRITRLEPKAMNGFIKFNRALPEEFFDQLESFPKGDYDDGPDALEMLWSLVNNRYEASAVSMSPTQR